MTASTTILLASPNPSDISQFASVDYTAIVYGGATLPTGTITFSSSSSSFSGSATLANGYATFTQTSAFATPGLYSLTASYGGDATYSASSASLGFTVSTAPTSSSISGFALVGSLNPSSDSSLPPSAQLTCIPASPTVGSPFTLLSNTVNVSKIQLLNATNGTVVASIFPSAGTNVFSFPSGVTTTTIFLLECFDSNGSPLSGYSDGSTAQNLIAACIV